MVTGGARGGGGGAERSSGDWGFNVGNRDFEVGVAGFDADDDTQLMIPVFVTTRSCRVPASKYPVDNSPTRTRTGSGRSGCCPLGITRAANDWGIPSPAS